MNIFKRLFKSPSNGSESEDDIVLATPKKYREDTVSWCETPSGFKFLRRKLNYRDLVPAGLMPFPDIYSNASKKKVQKAIKSTPTETLVKRVVIAASVKPKIVDLKERNPNHKEKINSEELLNEDELAYSELLDRDKLALFNHDMASWQGEVEPQKKT